LRKLFAMKMDYCATAQYLRRLLFIWLTTAMLHLASKASAAIEYDTWYGNADGYWSTYANWSVPEGGAYPSSDIDCGLIFGTQGVSRLINTNDIVGRGFDGVLIYTNGYDLRGDPIGIDTVLLASYPSGFSTIEPGLNFYGGRIEIDASGALLALNGPITIINTALLVINNGILATRGAWSGGGNYSVLFAGSGSVQLTASVSPFAGTVGVSNSTTILVFGAWSNALFNVASGTLNGGGTIGRVNMTGGQFQPGYSFGVGQMTVLSNFTANSSSTLSFRLAGTSPGTDYDQLLFTSTNGAAVSLGNAQLQLQPSGTPIPGSTFTIIDMAGTQNKVTGTFAGWPEGSQQFVGNAFYRITYAGGDGNDVVLTVTNVSAVWKGGGATPAWSLSSNWSNNVVPAQNYDVIFPITPATFTASNDLGGLQLNHLIFEGAGYHVTGASPQIRGGIIDSNTSVFNANYLDTGVKLLAEQSFLEAGFALYATNVIPGTNNLVLDGAGFYGLASLGAGTGTVTRVGGGSTVLFGTNAFTGAFNILDGYLTLDGGDASASSGIVVSNGWLTMAGLAPPITLVSSNALLRPGPASASTTPRAILISAPARFNSPSRVRPSGNATGLQGP
jgi:hypothetical protein